MKFTSYQSAIKSFIESVTKPEILFRNFSAAAVLAVLNIATAVSIASLIFSGPLTPYISVGIGLFLISTVVSGFLIPALSRYKALLAGPRAGQAPIFAVMAANIALIMQGQPVEHIVITVIGAILLTTFIVGAFMFMIGLTKIGTVVSYIPFPVMAGFFAGLGYLLAKGGVTVALGPLSDVSQMTTLLMPEILFKLIPAIVFGIVLFILDQRFQHWLIVPTYLAAAVGLFYLVLYVAGVPIEAAVEFGWLALPESNAAGYFPVFTLDQLLWINWGAILQQFDIIVVLSILSVIMLLLDISGVELIIGRDLEPNRELRSAGLSNMIGTFAGSPLGFGAAADTAVSYRLGGSRFLMILIYSALVVAVIVLGHEPIVAVPIFVVGGFLIYIGLTFLIEWVWRKRLKLPLTEVLVICIILGAIAVYGILEGVVVGLILTAFLFVHKYSQLNMIRASMTGAEFVTSIERHSDEQHYLDKNAHRVQIFILQGFLFFGSVRRLLDKIKVVVDSGDKTYGRYLLIDFSHTDEMDSSASNSFAKLMQICARENVVLCLIEGKLNLVNRLVKLGKDIDLPLGAIEVFSSLDEAVGWCDDKILEGVFDQNTHNHVLAPSIILNELINDAYAVQVISSYFDEVYIASDEILFKQGQLSDALYLILKGSIAIVLELKNQQPIIVRKMRTGAILGELALYTGEPRSASAYAKSDCVLYRLSLESYKKLCIDHPVEANVFSSYIVRLTAERLTRANRSAYKLGQ